ncbi:smoothelin-like 1 isoform X3 [Eleginops maclovinus]|uniref:smoothelin-like 1 isoform X3 n=1 Tax=Eleginops maclovinus TaxID=56733 RepID=UPI0030808A27
MENHPARRHLGLQIQPARPTPTTTTTRWMTKNHFWLLVLQMDEPQLEESKDPGREPPAGETVEGQGVMQVGEEESVPEQGGEEKASAVEADNPQTPSLKHVEGDAEEAEDKGSTDADVKDPETTSEKKEGEIERTEDDKSEEVKEDKCETDRDGEEMTDQTKEKKKTEQKAKEAKKDVKEKAAKGAEKKKQVEEVDVETTDKGKMKEVEKQGKPKRKSAPPSSSISRPRQTARSIRAAAKNDIIAKFQQGAPENPTPRNFKVQRSSSGVSTGNTIKQKMLQWCRSKTRNYEGVNIENFSSSWCDELSFHFLCPPVTSLPGRSLADCCPLLEVEDMMLMGKHPDPMCVFTYVQSLCHSLSKIEKERKDKEEKEKQEKDNKNGNEGEEKESGEVSPENEESAAENGTSQEEKQEGNTDTEGAQEEDKAPNKCELDEDREVVVKGDS